MEGENNPILGVNVQHQWRRIAPSADTLGGLVALHILKDHVSVEPPTPCASSRGRSFHVLVEEGDNFLRMLSEVIVTVLEAPGGALDPEQLLFLAAQQIEGLLRVLGIPCP
jgi:hypothetical protein